ncbi:MAG: 2-hydroxycarboxylate transporter family protein [Treponema phagedenis]|uniref:Citrate-sodium symporter n=2 Tax=Treponema phagedenis TaxID=162 RepID=A0A0B7H358_TREPH|nr:2-hydroxycarboxylate transporter family protein [Treponema phagedenis]QEJ94955.1 citrate-sodium symporter [Treponema phagedenis]QEJ98316.1 citrate-sodium symporter [Treponema phagedenis]QEK00858.1 citrate-sodium symporter [Treponema phagedenis]QEK03826.1 citrate-sodium symporter [Treponema phagedenis]QEK09441.1 citrate-sodium symporter [Treponema phagedenis]
MKKKSFKDLFDLKKFEWSGLSLPMFAVMVAIVLIIVYAPYKGVPGGFITSIKDGNVKTSISFFGMLTFLGVFGILFGNIGDRIPYWNDYVGGGTVLVFFAAAIFGTYQFVPETLLKAATIFYNKNPINFLDLFIPALIVGSVLTVNRHVLIKAIGGYIPLIIIGVIGSAIGGVAVGLLFGKAPLDVVMNYVLPIMGGGTGAGAIPLSEMWATKTGRPASEWFAFAISILTIANILAIITGALLNMLGEKKPSLTGNGALMMDSEAEGVKDKEDVVESGQTEFTAALFFTGGLTLLSLILGKLWELLNAPFEIHRLAFLIIITALLNIFNVVPVSLKSGAKKMQVFFAKHMIWVLMAAVGFETDVKEIINALSPSNFFIALAIVYGAIGLIMLVAKYMKFYPVEAAITAGLCMANRGGSGDVAVLGAAHRMQLMPFAQISSRIGGAMILILGSVIFGIFA